MKDNLKCIGISLRRAAAVAIVMVAAVAKVAANAPVSDVLLYEFDENSTRTYLARVKGMYGNLGTKYYYSINGGNATFFYDIKSGYESFGYDTADFNVTAGNTIKVWSDYPASSDEETVVVKPNAPTLTVTGATYDSGKGVYVVNAGQTATVTAKNNSGYSTQLGIKVNSTMNRSSTVQAKNGTYSVNVSSGIVQAYFFGGGGLKQVTSSSIRIAQKPAAPTLIAQTYDEGATISLPSKSGFTTKWHVNGGSVALGSGSTIENIKFAGYMQCMYEALPTNTTSVDSDWGNNVKYTMRLKKPTSTQKSANFVEGESITLQNQSDALNVSNYYDRYIEYWWNNESHSKTPNRGSLSTTMTVRPATLYAKYHNSYDDRYLDSYTYQYTYNVECKAPTMGTQREYVEGQTSTTITVNSANSASLRYNWNNSSTSSYNILVSNPGTGSYTFTIQPGTLRAWNAGKNSYLASQPLTATFKVKCKTPYLSKTSGYTEGENLAITYNSAYSYGLFYKYGSDSEKEALYNGGGIGAPNWPPSNGSPVIEARPGTLTYYNWGGNHSGGNPQYHSDSDKLTATISVNCKAPVITGTYHFNVTEGVNDKLTLSVQSANSNGMYYGFSTSTTSAPSWISAGVNSGTKQITITPGYLWAYNAGGRNSYSTSGYYKPTTKFTVKLATPSSSAASGTWLEDQTMTLYSNSSHVGTFGYTFKGNSTTIASTSNTDGTAGGAFTTTIQPGTYKIYNKASSAGITKGWVDSEQPEYTYTVRCHYPTANTKSRWTEFDNLTMTCNSAHTNGMQYKWYKDASYTTLGSSSNTKTTNYSFEVFPGELKMQNPGVKDGYAPSSINPQTFAVYAKDPLLTVDGATKEDTCNITEGPRQIKVAKRSRLRLRYKWSDQYDWHELDGDAGAYAELQPRQGVELQAYCYDPGNPAIANYVPYLDSDHKRGLYHIQCATPTLSPERVITYNMRLDITPAYEPAAARLAWAWDGAAMTPAATRGAQRIWARLGTLSAKTQKTSLVDSETATETYTTYRDPLGVEYRSDGCGGFRVTGTNPLTLSTVTIPTATAMHDGGEQYRVTSISAGAFTACANLRSLSIDNPVPPALDERAFTDEQYDSVNVSVPANLHDIYAAAPVWERFFRFYNGLDGHGAASGRTFIVRRGRVEFLRGGLPATVTLADGRVIYHGTPKARQSVAIPFGMNIIVRHGGTTEQHFAK